jgi:hypothetical protein
MGFLGWLSRFKLIRLRRISLATLPRYGRMGGRREKVRGVYRFSSLVKQNKNGNFFLFLKNLCYEVIVKQKIYKRSTNHQSPRPFICLDPHGLKPF